MFASTAVVVSAVYCHLTDFVSGDGAADVVIVKVSTTPTVEESLTG